MMSPHIWNKSQAFVRYCKDNYLELNVTKTQELIDYRRNKSTHVPVKINDNEVQQTTNYKYFGVVIDDCLNCSCTLNIFAKGLNLDFFVSGKWLSSK